MYYFDKKKYNKYNRLSLLKEVEFFNFCIEMFENPFAYEWNELIRIRNLKKNNATLNKKKQLKIDYL